MKIPYMDELIQIRNFMVAEVPQFPFSKCQLSIRLLNNILDLKEVAGKYVEYDQWHGWSLDEINNVYIDLTLSQFGKNHKNISILPVNTKILNRIDVYTENHLFLEDTKINWDLKKNKTVLDLINEYKKKIQIIPKYL